MNNKYLFTRSAGIARFYAVVTIVSLLLSAFPASVFVADAAWGGGNQNPPQQQPKIDICHWNQGQGGGYTVQSVDMNATAGGHAGIPHQNGKDIIPPYNYAAKGGPNGYPAGHFDGQNWDNNGQLIYRNNCSDKGTIIVNKVVVGTAAVTEDAFDLYVGDKEVKDEEDSWKNKFEAGTYTVTESPKTGVPTDYTVTFGGDCDANGQVTVGIGETKTCVITNDYTPQIAGIITIQKILVGVDIKAVFSDFHFTINGGDPIQFEADGSNEVAFGFGTAPYYVTEVEENGAGYETTYDSCAQMGIGDTCTIINTFTEPEQEVATVIAHKIVCTDEADVPNQVDWSTLDPINANTAQAWVDSHDSCSFASGWDFEWVLNSQQTDPGDTLVGPAGGDWMTFGSTDVNGMTSVGLTADDLAGNTKIWLREVLKDGYIPFTHGATPNNTDDYSAALFCNNDVLNYDNLEWIANISLNSTYYCVAWNVPEESLDVCPNLEGDQATIPAGYVVDNAGNCVPDEEPVDLCPNLEGDQATVPAGYVVDDAGNCVIPDNGGVCEIGDNLLVNGSFEDPVVTNKNLWDSFTSVLGWTVTQVVDEDPSELELHRGWSGNEAAHGEQYVELDGDDANGSSVRIAQKVTLEEGAKYELRWAFAPRQNTAASENQLSVLLDNVEVGVSGPQAGIGVLTQASWTPGSYEFVADETSTEVAFEDAGTPQNDEYGTFLDNAVLCKVAEPVRGCTDREANNYDEDATVDDQSCQFDEEETRTSSGGGGSSVPRCTLFDADRDGSDITLNWKTTHGSRVVITSGTDQVLETIDPDEVDEGSFLLSSSDAAEYLLTVYRGSKSRTCTAEVLALATPTPQVLGEQTSVVPYGAPNTGAGGTSPVQIPTAETLSAIVLRTIMRVTKNG